MNDDDIFAKANPFHTLAKKALKAQTATKISAKEKPKAPKNAIPELRSKAQDSISDDDTISFLDAMRHVTTKAVSKKQGRHTQTLDNHLPLPKSRHDAPTESKPSDKKGTLPQTSATPILPAKDRESAPMPDANCPEYNEDITFMDAMQTVMPLANKGRDIPAPPKPTHILPPPPEPNPLEDVMPSNIEFTLASTREYVEGHVVGLDLMLLGKLQAGQFHPEAHIDLHGLDTQQAYLALTHFFKIAYYKNHRTVLVVPGRGLNSPAGMAVLREKVQTWLTQEPLKRVVLAFCTAKPIDGGAGALYVLFRKYKKSKGKIIWHRSPVDTD